MNMVTRDCVLDMTLFLKPHVLLHYTKVGAGGGGLEIVKAGPGLGEFAQWQ